MASAKGKPVQRRAAVPWRSLWETEWSRDEHFAMYGALDLQGNQVLISIADTLRLLVERQENLERRVAELARDNHALADYAGGNVPALRIMPADVRLAPYKVARPKGDMPRLRLTPRSRPRPHRGGRAGASIPSDRPAGQPRPLEPHARRSRHRGRRAWS
jgi:hypothetical protein